MPGLNREATFASPFAFFPVVPSHRPLPSLSLIHIFEALAPYLEGPSAVAISSTDATAPARELAKFAKTADKLEIKAGVVEGTVYDAAGMAAIFQIPSRDELLSKLLGSIQSPIANCARVMKMCIRDRVATMSKDKIREIAETKMPDLNAASVEAAMSMIAGTARSMGIVVED